MFNQDTLQFTNVHAGVCAFVGADASNTNGGLIQNLVSILQMDELKTGNLGLQTALVNLMRNEATHVEDKKWIRPQLISTLPVFVDFPTLQTPFKPCMTRKQRIMTAAG